MQTLLFPLRTISAESSASTSTSGNEGTKVFFRWNGSRAVLPSFEQQCAWADEWAEEAERTEEAA